MSMTLLHNKDMNEVVATEILAFLWDVVIALEFTSTLITSVLRCKFSTISLSGLVAS